MILFCFIKIIFDIYVFQHIYYLLVVLARAIYDIIFEIDCKL